ncbi:hypothetical protein ACH4SP_22265 [Streptomyces sp. NPDC021093]|uniref:hypothetical protein n=1 Tax=Streptomyces sp. NPDC021093 TaxID=3365112 RepID=UPI0037ACB3BD
MTMRRTMKARRALTAVAITTGLAIAVAGCGGGEKDGQTPPPSSPQPPAKGADRGTASQSAQPPAGDTVLAEVKGGDNITLTINSAIRDQGGFVTLNGKVKNGGAVLWSAPNWQGSEQELASNQSSLAGASLIDKKGKKKYLILRDTDGRCLCTKFANGIPAKQETIWFAQFPAPPAGTKKVDFQVGDMPPAAIEISDGE